MVATRRGARVAESSKINSDESVSSQTTTTCSRRTRGTAKDDTLPLAGCDNTQTTGPVVNVTNVNDQDDKLPEEENETLNTVIPDEGKESDVESCCSFQSGAQTPGRRSTRRRGQMPTSEKLPGTGGVSEAESCTSIASTPSTALRRSTRKQRVKAAQNDDEVSEAESCSSVMSLSKQSKARVLTRSRRKTPGPPNSNTEDTELSEHDSHDLRTSTLRKSTRTRKPVQPLPIDLEDSGDISSSSTSRRPPTRRSRAAPVQEANPGVTEVEESGTSSMRSTRSRPRGGGIGKARSDSESETTIYSPVGSPLGSGVGHSTPCSSRTSSASSHRAVSTIRVTRSHKKVLPGSPLPITSEVSTLVDGRGVVVTAQDDAPLPDIMDTGDEHEATVTEAEGDGTLVALEEKNEAAVVKALTLTEEEAVKAASKSVVIAQSASPDEAMDTIVGSVEVKEEPAPQQVLRASSSPLATEVSILVSQHALVVTAPDEAPLPEAMDTEAELQATVSEEVEDQTLVEEENEEAASVVKGSAVPEEETVIESASAGEDIDMTTVNVEAKEEAAVQQSNIVVTVEDDDNKGVTECVYKQAELKPNSSIVVTLQAGDSDELTLASMDEPKPIEMAPPDDNGEDTLTVMDEKVEQGDHLPGAAANAPVGEHACQAVVLSSLDSTVQIHDRAEEGKEDEATAVEISEQPVEEPSGSGISKKPATVSLLDSSDDDDDEGDSDACSLAEKQCAGIPQALDSEDDDDDEEDAIVSSGSRPVIKTQRHPDDGGLFVIDTAPGLDPAETYYSEKQHQKIDEVEQGTGETPGTAEEEEEFVDEEDDDDTQILYSSKGATSKELSCRIDPGLRMREMGGLYISLDGSKSKPVSSSSLHKRREQTQLDELMKKSIVGPDFEKKECVPSYKEARNAVKQKRREERAKTTGEGWFNMKAPEMTEELKNDLKVLQMRSALDPKRFYKKNDREGFAKYVQVGTVVDSPLDFYHSRIPKKERKRTIVEELMADAEFRSYNKKKYQELVTEKAALLSGKKHWKKHKSKAKS